jgi:hypothetical protein
MKSRNEIRRTATAFSKRWKNAYDEKIRAQSFLRDVFDGSHGDMVYCCRMKQAGRGLNSEQT